MIVPKIRTSFSIPTILIISTTINLSCALSRIFKCADSQIWEQSWTLPGIASDVHGNESVKNNVTGYEFSLPFHSAPLECKHFRVYTVSTEEHQHVQRNGSLRINGHIHSPQDYCLFRFNASAAEVQVCDCKQGEICVPKCCPNDQVLQTDLKVYALPSCVPTQGEGWRPFVQRKAANASSNVLAPLVDEDLELGLVGFQFPECPPEAELHLHISSPDALRALQAEIQVLETGEVRIKSVKDGHWGDALTEGEFCVDGFWDSGSSGDFSRTISNQIVITCSRKPLFYPGKQVNVVVIIFTTCFVCLVVSTIFFLLTLSVYCLLWDQQNVHGWTIMANVTSMLLYFGSLSVSMGVLLYYKEGIGTTWCKGLGIFQHYFNMATYTWLSVLGYDLWTTVSSRTPVSSHGRKQFGLYCLYGYGMPLLLLTLALSIEFHFGVVYSNLVRPDYGRVSCGLSGGLPYYYYAVVTTMLLYMVNLVFAVLMIVSYLSARRATARASSASTKAQTNGIIFAGKLSLIFGFSWIFEFIFSNMTIEVYSATFWMRVVITVVNTLQGVGLFWVFVWQERIKGQLQVKLKKMRGTTPRTVLKAMNKSNLRTSFDANDVSTSATTSVTTIN